MFSMFRVCLAFILFILFVHHTDQQASKQESNPCTNAQTCGECIRTSSVCAWCASDNFESHQSRCDLKDLFVATGICQDADLQSPDFAVKIERDDDVRGGGVLEEAIQVQPQNITLRVRPNQPVTLQLQFRQAENYPVDLYFLLDMSYSMIRERNAKAWLVRLGKAMSKSMSEITKDAKLGFGSFVDKLTMPFVAWTEEMLTARCPVGVTCRRPYAFKNQQGLTRNMTLFSDKMSDALQHMSQSLDNPEGGMDGMIQVLACDDQIGWRERSRRMIVYSSNFFFHIAGDGKLGGAVGFNDGVCHLDNGGSYSTYDKILDYPSVSQLAAKVKEKKANVVFAVMGDVYDVHNRLASFIEGSAVDKLEKDGTNIIKLVRDNYDKLRSTIKFLPENAEDIEVTFQTRCTGKVMQTTNECSGLELGESVVFDVTINVSPELCKRTRRSFDIQAVGLAEKLTLNLDLICECECEKPGNEEKNSPKCFNGNGTFECGQCTCNPKRYGRNCECDEAKLSSQKSLEKCKSNPNSTVVCSDHGDCVCGVCECFSTTEDSARRYSGEFCECNDYSCDYYERQLCGGPTRGVCKCGTCQCLPGYSTINCGCSTRNDTCMASNGKLCFGQGECVCGRCQCDPRTQYRGPTCEDCPTCPSKCSLYRPCAQCMGFGSGEYASDCSEKCSEYQFEMVPTIQESKDVRTCPFNDDDGCLFRYTYEYDPDNNVILRVQTTKECPTAAPVMAISLGIVGGIVLIGIIIILLILFIKKRQEAKEFAAFEREKERARWESDANPIYKTPKSTYQNPTYRGADRKTPSEDQPFLS
ncbi:integrin beta-1-B-like [Gigantopelta aegis]|uniref:integrin beta-1-B-like n=1 Tax=Gigantopelta aegis TaxID=1735272 RepID=UPI001B8874C6|nr:integrin beta-1-B-like [Gigantopelta aegis]